MGSKNGGCWTSWPIIILFIFLCWPVGLFLLIKKLTNDKTAAISAGGKGLKVVGIVMTSFAAIGTLGFLVSLTEDGASGDDLAALIVMLFFAIGGIALLRKAKKLKKESESIKQYLSIIVNGNVRQLDDIAFTTGQSYDAVHRNVQNMIEKGFLKNAYIDERTREVVLPNAAPVSPQNDAPTYASTINAVSTNPVPLKTKIVACPCCGANNTITGDTGECEYCGSPLK